MSENPEQNVNTSQSASKNNQSNPAQAKDEIPKFVDDYQATKEETQALLERILDKIASRFVKKYLPPLENVLEETQYFIPVEFYECKNKLPVPEHKVVVIFKVLRTLQKDGIFFQIDLIPRPALRLTHHIVFSEDPDILRIQIMGKCLGC